MPDIPDRLMAAFAEHYDVERELGSGGMATVYLARDLKHQRSVALKVLRPELAAILGGERFLKEIEVTANLQHPNILPLYDSGEADSFLYYVMPFMEGESLRDKLEREVQLSVEEAVDIARSVAAALEYAHQREVIHRDIKPANILLQAGQALVADFGIALAVSEAGGQRLTETGLSLGTPHYMSPEQATGDRALDPRSDIYSLGCVTYEMLTGEPPHMGNSVQAVIARILQDTPAPITRSRELVPPNVAAAVQKAIAKSPADRFGSAASFADALANPSFLLPTTGVTPAHEALVTVRWRRRAMIATALSGVLALAAIWGWMRPREAGSVSRQRIELWAQHPTMWDIGHESALAPDGSAIAFADTLQGERRLFVKERNEVRPTPFMTTSGAFGPFFSPDGQWVGFWMNGQLKKMPRSGGAAVTVADSAQRMEPAGAWLDDGTIVFARGEQLVRVSADGGAVTEVADGGVPGLWYITALPNARGVLMSSCTGDCDYPAVHVMDLRTGTRTRLFEEAIAAAYVQTGHLVYVRPDGGLFATPFDQDALELQGTTVKVLDNVATSGPSAHFTLTEGGTLLYMAGPQIAQTGLAEAVWVDREGSVALIDSSWTFRPAQESGLALSPDGSMLAVGIKDDATIDVWIKNLPNGPFSRLTFADSVNDRPSWTSDGHAVTYVARGQGGCDVMARRADGSIPPETQLQGRNACLARWSTNREWLVYREDGDDRRGDILAIRPGEGEEPMEVAVTPFHETSPEVSPDGRWLAYASDESGRAEVYLRPFPDVQGGKRLVSTAGGSMPFWARDSRELFYINGEGQLVAARIDTGPPLSITSTTLFDMARQYAGVSNNRAGVRMFDVGPDGRFIALRGAGSSRIAETVDIVLVENWIEELKETLDEAAGR